MEMSQRPPHDDEAQFALWNDKRPGTAVDAQSVVVAHRDIPVGESVALLLRLKGFAAVATPTLDRLQLMLEHWKPGALLIDTRLCGEDDFQFVRDAVANPAFRGVLIVAMTNVFPEETPSNIRRIGFDGLCRRPCPVWRLAEVLLQRLGPPAD